MLRALRRDVRIIAQTPAYAHAKPRVSVILVASHGHEQDIAEALAGVTASLYDALEVLILDEAPSDDHASAVSRFLHEHSSLPAQRLRLHRRVNRGAANSRNILARRVRGEYLFILDPTGGIYPSTLQRFVTALDADPGAVFAYSMVAVFESDRPVELRGSLPWEPERLASGNWIDGMVLLRRARLLELGGYSTDPDLAGCEDFDLWCRCAQAGDRGVHVPGPRLAPAGYLNKGVPAISICHMNTGSAHD